MRLGLFFLTCLVLPQCSHAPDRSTPASARLVRASLAQGGRSRSYLYLDPKTGSAAKRPLLLALHGRLGDGAGQDRLTGFAALAEEAGFLLVLPDGVDRSWNDARGAGPAADQGIDDVGFLTAIIDEFVATHGADPNRVYVAGMSNGALMAHTLACRAASRVAAIVAVTGNVPERLPASCTPTRPVSVALILGTEDPLMPYAGGDVANGRGRVLSATASAELWAGFDGCGASQEVEELPDVDPTDGTRIERRQWNDCKEGSAVALYTVKGGGHTWPGGWAYLGERLVGRVSRDLDATRVVWEFFKAHPRP